MANITLYGHSVKRLPFYIDDAFTGEYVTYMGDLPNDHYQIVTDKRYFYDVDLDQCYILEYEDKICLNTAYNWRDFTGELQGTGSKGGRKNE